MAERHLPSPENISDLKVLKMVALVQKHVISLPASFVSKSEIGVDRNYFISML